MWRAGIDLNPLDVRDDDDMAWLETLVWPDQPDRAARLHAAIAVARKDPPRIVSGDLLSALPALAAEAPKDATLVVFHTAVLSYVDAADRAGFVRTVRDLDAVWISNEAPFVFPDIAARLAAGHVRRGPLLLSLDGEPIAWTDPHGAWIDWIGSVPAQ